MEENRLEEIIDELEYENRLIKDELIYAEEAVVISVKQLEDCIQSLNEVKNYLKYAKGGPKEKIVSTIQTTENCKKQLDSVLEKWLTARGLRKVIR